MKQVKGPTVSATVSPELKRIMAVVADETGVSESTLIRNAIAEYLEYDGAYELGYTKRRSAPRPTVEARRAARADQRARKHAEVQLALQQARAKAAP